VSCPGYVDQTHCPPFATGGSYSLSGVVTLRTAKGTAPLANTGIGAYVITASGTSYGLAPVTTDADGRYEFSNIPSGHVVLGASAPRAYQACAAVATVNGANNMMNFELVDSAVTRLEAVADSPTLSGTVYRSTNAGRQPVAGAVIEFEYSPVIAATTTTDALGRYSLCHLPTGRGGVEIWLNGVSVGGSVVTITGDQVLNLDVRQ
jgi:hypothetical protein